MATKWLRDAFSAKSVRNNGGVIRRKTTTVEKESSKEDFIELAKNMDAWAVFETESQMIAIFKTKKGVSFHHWKNPTIR